MNNEEQEREQMQSLDDSNECKQQDKTRHNGKKKGSTRTMWKVLRWFIFLLLIFLVSTYVLFFIWSAIAGSDTPRGVHWFFPFLPE